MPLTNTVWENIKLRQGTREPGSFRIGRGGGGSVLQAIATEEYIDLILREGIETAVADNDTGRIRRTLPVSHPKYGWHFLRNVDNVQGISFVEKLPSDPGGLLEVPPIPYYSQYQEYEFQATFEPRPYALLEDDSIESYDITYYGPDDDGGSAVGGTSVALTKAAWTEYDRYTEWLRAPAAEYLTADVGQYKFSNAGILTPGRNGPRDNTPAGGAQIRVLVPSSVWKIKWYSVPYQYVLSDNSYFERYVGHVNQAEIWGWLPGQALVQAVNVLDVYSPPFPEFTSFTGYDAVSQDKLCDLEIILLTNNRVASYEPDTRNRSHVIHGHNTVLFALNGKAYYVEANRKDTDGAGLGRPIYPSVPLDLLFQNPDGP